MKFLIEINLPDYFKADTEESIRGHVERTLMQSPAFASSDVKVTVLNENPDNYVMEGHIDPRIKEIGYGSGLSILYVRFRNGAAVCSCHNASNSKRVPNLRD